MASGAAWLGLWISLVAAQGPQGAAADQPIPENPLDLETLALIEALTTTVADALPPSTVEDHSLKSALARTADGALRERPSARFSLRGALGRYRYLDGLRVDGAQFDLGQLDPALYRVQLRRNPDGRTTTRLWVSELHLRGLEMPEDGWRASGRLEARTSDRSGGFVVSSGYAEEGFAFQGSLRGDASEDLRIKTATSAATTDGSGQALGGSFRSRLGKTTGWSSVLGYDFDLPTRADRRDFHAGQLFLHYREEQIAFSAGGGVIDYEDKTMWQTSLGLDWKPTDEVQIATGALQTHEADRLTRLEAFVQGTLRTPSVEAALSGRLSQQGVSGPDPSPNAAFDARIQYGITRFAWLQARYARSYAFREVGQMEEVDIVSLGPTLRLDRMTLSISGWTARVTREFAWGLDGKLDVKLGPLEWTSLVTRAHGLDPEPALRLSSWVTFSLKRAQLELGGVLVLEGAGYIDEVRAPPRERLFVRGQTQVTDELSILVSAVNLSDAPFRPFPGNDLSQAASDDFTSGIDFRLAVQIATP